MNSIDPFASVTASVLDLLARDGDLFLTLGTNLFRGLAVIVIAWFGMNLIFGIGSTITPGVQQEIAWQAHVGGFLAGILLIRVFRQDRSRMSYR